MAQTLFSDTVVSLVSQLLDWRMQQWHFFPWRDFPTNEYSIILKIHQATDFLGRNLVPNFFGGKIIEPGDFTKVRKIQDPWFLTQIPDNKVEQVL